MFLVVGWFYWGSTTTKRKYFGKFCYDFFLQGLQGAHRSLHRRSLELPGDLDEGTEAGDLNDLNDLNDLSILNVLREHAINWKIK